jgi:hypothetical protein
MAKPYYYLAVSARVDGKPRIVDQKYLGTAEDIEAAMAGATAMPSRTWHLGFGDLAATWAVIEQQMIVELTARHRELDASAPELTVVFDAGQNSQPNFALLAEHQLHYVGSLPPSDHPALLDPRHRLPASRRVRRGQRPRDHPGRAGALASGGADPLPGTELHETQSRGFDQTLAKATPHTRQDRRHPDPRQGPPQPRPAGNRDHQDLLTRWVNQVLSCQISGRVPPWLRLTYTIDTAARHTLQQRLFGKRILITDHTDWSTAEVIADTAPHPTPSSASANSKTPMSCRSPPCTTGPRPTSACTPSPAYSPS